MGNQYVIKTIIVPAGNTYITDRGCASIDFLYYGTVDGVTFQGGAVGSQPVPIPPNVPYTLEFQDNGYAEVIVVNNGDADVYIVQKY